MHLADYLFFCRLKLSNKKTWKLYKTIEENHWMVPLTLNQFNSVIEDENTFNEIETEISKGKPQPDFISIADSIYPPQLKEIFNPPIILYYSGNLDLLKENTVTIVGGRQLADYGALILDELVPNEIKQGNVIVSGLAKGVDGTASKLAIENSGKTIVVLGNGLGVSYPRENKELQEQITKVGLLLSEYRHDERPKQHYFLERNRILAGLSPRSVIVQARKMSGTLITAEIALQENREVLTFPARVNDEDFDGNNELIAQGASIYELNF